MSTAIVIAASGSLDCPNGACGYDAGYSTASTIALVALGLVAVAVIVALVLLVRAWRG